DRRAPPGEADGVPAPHDGGARRRDRGDPRLRRHVRQPRADRVVPSGVTEEVREEVDVAFIELADGDGTNFERAFAHRPDVCAAWRGLVGAMTANMDERRYELVPLAAARELRSSYCCLAHGRVLATRLLPAETVTAAARDPHSAGLEPVEVAA